MAGLKAGKAYVRIHDSVALRDLSAYVTAVHMSLKGHALIDVTTMGDSGHKWASDELQDASFSIDFLYEATANGVMNTLLGLRYQTTAYAFEIGPAGSGSGEYKITGTCFIEEIPVESVIGDMVRLTGVTFKIQDVPTVATY